MAGESEVVVTDEARRKIGGYLISLFENILIYSLGISLLSLLLIYILHDPFLVTVREE